MRAGCITKVQAAEVHKYSLMEDALNGPRRLETIPLVRANIAIEWHSEIMVLLIRMAQNI